MDKVCAHSEHEICQSLPGFHSITGCDTTSFPFRVRKVRPFKEMVNKSKAKLLFKLGENEVTANDLSDATKFFQTVMYNGEENESIGQTRIRMYDGQKVKSSCPLIPDPSSAEQHIQRADYQTTIWRQCMLENINYKSAIGEGWYETEEGLRPLWYTVTQLPLGSLINRKLSRTERKMK